MNLFTKIDLIDPVEVWDCICQTILTLECVTTYLVVTCVMESLFIEIVRANTKNIVVGVIYRLPKTNVDAFVSKHSEIVENTLNRKQILLFNE